MNKIEGILNPIIIWIGRKLFYPHTQETSFLLDQPELIFFPDLPIQLSEDEKAIRNLLLRQINVL